MKKWFMSGLFLAFSALAVSGQTLNPRYDPVLAGKHHAPDNGMKYYVLAVLKTGPNQTAGKAFVDSCFTGHMANIGRLAEEKKLIVAGPLEKNERTYRGIFILDLPIEEVPEVLKTDPAIRGGLLDYELYRWYGSAALPEYMEADDKIWRIR